MDRDQLAEEIEEILTHNNVNAGLITELRKLPEADDPAAKLDYMLGPHDAGRSYGNIYRGMASGLRTALDDLRGRIRDE